MKTTKSLGSQPKSLFMQKLLSLAVFTELRLQGIPVAASDLVLIHHYTDKEEI